ncbi:MAG: nuclear transport factor 2 family protein, partial [Gammaproteobacteria bacterium]
MAQENQVTPEFLASFTQAWNDKDIDKLMSHMADDCVFMASVGLETEGALWTGTEKVREGFASLWI